VTAVGATVGTIPTITRSYEHKRSRRSSDTAGALRSRAPCGRQRSARRRNGNAVAGSGNSATALPGPSAYAGGAAPGSHICSPGCTDRHSAGVSDRPKVRPRPRLSRAPFRNGSAERSAPRHPRPRRLSPWGGSGPRPSRRPQPPAAPAPRSVERDMARLSWRHLSATARFTPSGGVRCEREPRRALSTPASCEATLARIREMGEGVSPRAP
jgi:hypothetical protein